MFPSFFCFPDASKQTADKNNITPILEERAEASENHNDDELADMEVVHTPPSSPTGGAKNRPRLDSL